MFLEKLKEHGLKIMFFAVNLLLVLVGVLFIKQKSIESANIIAKETDAQNYKLAVDYALAAQASIFADKQAKIDSIANNPPVVVIPTVDVVSPPTTVEASNLTPKPTPTPAPKPVVVAPVIASVVAPVKISGKCGSANSSKERGNSNCNKKAPSANLCSAGTASAISFKPNKYDLGWNWTCAGKNGGASATCRCS
jgi:hypothetical protein